MSSRLPRLTALDRPALGLVMQSAALIALPTQLSMAMVMIERWHKTIRPPYPAWSAAVFSSISASLQVISPRTCSTASSVGRPMSHYHRVTIRAGAPVGLNTCARISCRSCHFSTSRTVR